MQGCEIFYTISASNDTPFFSYELSDFSEFAEQEKMENPYRPIQTGIPEPVRDTK